MDLEIDGNFTVNITTGARFYVALCPEAPQAHGQGETPEEARADLMNCIAFILESGEELTHGTAVVPNHDEIDEVIVDRICDQLGVPRPGR